MNWPDPANLDDAPPERPLVLEASDGDVATYQTCTNPKCPAIKPGTEHAHLIRVVRAEDQPDSE